MIPDYPIEKLDVKFVLEPDDRETRRALDRLDPGAPFEIITAPAAGPRTKPKALNVALPLARGLYTAVYDAEDEPEPDQLRRAAAELMAGDERLVCLQASLTIDNAADNWLARMFTADYAGQFDVMLPALAALHLPFPLGGSSNHFRTSVLRQVGGWDPYNVTEDADLGIRLHRLGYRAAALPSATYEEAPAQFVPWLKQRTRWYKGWMQTWLVHMRRPSRLVHEVGASGAIAFQLFFACNVLAALIHPFFMAALGYALLARPLYWLLLSLAAWRALLQLLHDPQRWEKTEHGLGKHSRVAELKLRTKLRRVPGPATPITVMARPAVARPAVARPAPSLRHRSRDIQPFS